jgi:hypothetical protein
MASSSEPSKKWGRAEDDDDDESCRRKIIKVGTVPAPESTPPPKELEEVSSLPPEEAPALPPVEAAPIPNLHHVDIWSVNMLLEAFRRLRQVAIEVGLQRPNKPL